MSEIEIYLKRLNEQWADAFDWFYVLPWGFKP